MSLKANDDAVTHLVLGSVSDAIGGGFETLARYVFASESITRSGSHLIVYRRNCFVARWHIYAFTPDL
jgi:hypothetical protein